jgi:hypothetical protein
MSSFSNYILKYMPIPKSMTFAHAGVDIGTNHIRHVLFAKAGDTLRIKHFGVYEVPTISHTLPLLDQTDILLALKKMQKEYGYTNVEVSLPEELVYIYTADVDGKDMKSMRTQVEFRLEENVPLKVDEAIFDVTPVLYIKETGKSLVSVAVVARKTVQEYTDLFKRASMDIVSFLVQNQALSKTLIAKDDAESYCIVAVEKKSIIVSIVSTGTVLYTATIDQSVFTDTMELERKEVLQDIVRDIYKIVVFWLSYIGKNKSYGFKPLKAMILSSTHRDILESDFAHMLSRELAFQVRLADVWVNVQFPQNVVPEIHKKDSYQYATAIGLAMPKL